MQVQGSAAPRLSWLEPLKALALLGILLNHAIEALGPSAWFTNPGRDWPALAWRLEHFFPDLGSAGISWLTFLGWLGDSGPGVFIILSGFGLTWSALQRPADPDYLRHLCVRLARILPLYVLVHWGTLALAALLPDVAASFEDPRVFISLAGVRATHELFQFLNPSWWFIWLILQLYVVFPLLLRILRRHGALALLLGSLAVTVLSRGYGIAFAEHRYDWLTGLFFGSRLAEFAAGMAAAHWALSRRAHLDTERLPLKAVLLFAAPAYGAGLTASLFLPSVLISNLLVSVGLTGLLYCVWRAVAWAGRPLSDALTWIGGVSYAVFLLHQAPLNWAMNTLSSQSMPLRIAVAGVVLVASFPAARACELLLQRFRSHADALVRLPGFAWIVGAFATAMFGLLVLADDAVADPAKREVFAFLLGSAVLITVALEWAAAVSLSRAARGILWTAAAGALLYLFVLGRGHGLASALFAVAAGVTATLAHARAQSRRRAIAYAVAATGAAVMIAELVLRVAAPLETSRWGEYPVLTRHATRVYALKPAAQAHLRYNNYDYSVRTNAAGLSMGPISAQRPAPDTLRILALGNAFTMPEGVDYEQSWTQLLQATLRRCLAPRTVEVINAGVTGYSATQKLPQFRELSALYQPDIVIEQFFATEFEWVTWSPDKQLHNIGLARDPHESVLDGVLGASQVLAHLERASGELMAALRGGMSPWRQSRALLRYHQQQDEDVYSERAISLTRDYLSTLQHEAARNGMSAMVMFVPTALSIMPWESLGYAADDLERDDPALDLERPRREFGRVMAQVALPWLDLSAPLREAAATQPYFADSWHWTAAGHDVAARAVVQELVARGFVGSRCAAEALPGGES